MNRQTDGLTTADEVRALNCALDAELLSMIEGVTEYELRVDAGDEWSIDKNLGHIAEFPRYFARQLRQWLAGERIVLGRVAEYSADRNDAVVRSKNRPLDELVREARESFRQLSDVLEQLQDEHLDSMITNVKYGEERLSAFLDRYILGHKTAHVHQLRAAIEDVRAR